MVTRYALSIIRAGSDAEKFGRIVGAASVKAATRDKVPSVADRYAQVDQRIGGITWPDRDFVVTAVDVESGELASFGPRGDHASVSLADAVNASCAVPLVYPPIPIEGRTYIDGGSRSGANADLMTGMDVIVAIVPVDRAIGPLRSAAQQLEQLGAPHVTVLPDEASKAAIGKNVLDPAARPPSARAGYAQAAAEIERIRTLWA